MSESPYSFEVTQENFNELVLEKSYETPVMVDFWAAWCAPCRMLMPMLAKLVDEYQGQFLLAKVNTDAEQELAAANGIRSLPTVRIYKGGKVVDEFMGVQPEPAIRESIERHLFRASDASMSEAKSALAAGDTDKAAQLLEQVLAADEHNLDARLSLANIFLGQKQFAKVEDLLAKVRIDLADDPEVHALRARLQFAQAAEKAPPAEALEKTLRAEPGDLEAHYQLGAIKVLEGDYEGALEQFLEIRRRDRSYREDAGRKSMLAVFDLLGGGPLVNRYRAKMASILL